MNASSSVSPGPIAIPEADLTDLRQRLAVSRFTAPSAPGWALGPDGAFLAEFCRYWRDDFDWRVWEQRFNAHDPTLVGTTGGDVHCLHARSRHADATPLLITHGWPGSVVEIVGIIDSLVDPTAHGGSPDDAFHVVCPSLPGYGFSPPAGPGTSIRVVARMLAEVMAALGYDRYIAQGGDWGAIATGYLALDAPARLLGIHLNTVIAYPPAEGDPTAGLSPKEQAQYERFVAFGQAGMAYVMVHATRPHALAPGLEDSPVGLAAWILDKFHAWSDNDGSLPGPFTMDELAANVSVYWLTRSIASSILLYTWSVAAGELGPLPARVEVPTGCAVFPHEILVPARRWADAAYNVTHWSELGAGGHFAALEQPDALVADIRAFARTLRP